MKSKRQGSRLKRYEQKNAKELDKTMDKDKE